MPSSWPTDRIGIAAIALLGIYALWSLREVLVGLASDVPLSYLVVVSGDGVAVPMPGSAVFLAVAAVATVWAIRRVWNPAVAVAGGLSVFQSALVGLHLFEGMAVLQLLAWTGFLGAVLAAYREADREPRRWFRAATFRRASGIALGVVAVVAVLQAVSGVVPGDMLGRIMALTAATASVVGIVRLDHRALNPAAVVGSFLALFLSFPMAAGVIALTLLVATHGLESQGADRPRSEGTSPQPDALEDDAPDLSDV